MIQPAAREFDVIAGQSRRDEVRAGFDAVRDHVMLGPVEGLAPFNLDDVGAGAPNARAHRVEQIGQVDDLRFPRGVAQEGRAFGQRRRHHQVLRPGDRLMRKRDVRAGQPFGTGFNVAVIDLDLGSHTCQPVDVQVDRALADGATARKRDPGATPAGQDRAQHQDRGTHRLDQFVRRLV